MSQAPNFYDTLGIKPTATVSEIRHAHRKLLHQNHPDKLHHLAKEFPWVEQTAALRFKRINEAFNVLSHHAARTRYDATLNRSPDFVSRFAPPIYDDPGKYRWPAPQPSQESSDIYTCVSEDEPMERMPAADPPFFRYPIPAGWPSQHFEPRPPERRKNFFLSSLALSTVLAVVYAASHYLRVDQQTYDWLLQQEQGQNSATHSAPVRTPAPSPAPESKSLKHNSSKSPANSPVKPPDPLTPTNQEK